MNICRTCTRQDVCNVSQYDDFCLNYDEKPQTNADKIRAMTDEELAEMFSDLETIAYERCGFKGNKKRFKSQYLDWLKQEVSE